MRGGLSDAVTPVIARFFRDRQQFEVTTPDGQRFELGPDEVLVDAKSPEGFAAMEEAGYLVAFDTTLTRELELEGLARSLEGAVPPLLANPRKEWANRPFVRDQAFGDALDPNKLERLGRYEVHLDRKLERMLTMLLRLKELRRPAVEI